MKSNPSTWRRWPFLLLVFERDRYGEIRPRTRRQFHCAMRSDRTGYWLYRKTLPDVRAVGRTGGMCDSRTASPPGRHEICGNVRPGGAPKPSGRHAVALSTCQADLRVLYQCQRISVSSFKLGHGRPGKGLTSSIAHLRDRLLTRFSLAQCSLACLILVSSVFLHPFFSFLPFRSDSRARLFLCKLKSIITWLSTNSCLPNL